MEGGSATCVEETFVVGCHEVDTVVQVSIESMNEVRDLLVTVDGDGARVSSEGHGELALDRVSDVSGGEFRRFGLSWL